MRTEVFIVFNRVQYTLQQVKSIELEKEELEEDLEDVKLMLKTEREKRVLLEKKLAASSASPKQGRKAKVYFLSFYQCIFKFYLF